MTVPETHVPADETPAATCPYCARPFTSTRLRDVHVGEAHAEAATPAEREAAETARDDEADDVYLYHMLIMVALAILTLGTTMFYMAVLAAGLA